MNIERDKFLTEAMGECWHDKAITNGILSECSKCKVLHSYLYTNADFSTWKGFGKLVTEHNKIGLTTIEITELIQRCTPYEPTFPDRFATQVYKILTSKALT